MERKYNTKMKKASLSLAKRFRELMLNGVWIANTNYKDQLSTLNWKIATSKVNELNTIAILAQHIHYYINGVINVFKGGNLNIKDKYSFNFAPIQSQKAWENFLDNFWHDAEEFASFIEKMPDEKLETVFVDEKYGTYRRNIEGMIEHGYYHLGQIVLIKKLILEEKKN